MDPQNAQFYSLFVAPDLIIWKAQELKERAQGMTEDEILHAYKEIQYIASAAVSTSDHVKSVRRANANSLPAPEPDEDDLRVESVEPERNSPPKKKKKRRTTPVSDKERLRVMKKRGPLSNCPTPQARAIRQIRFDKVLSQKDFGKAIGVHPVSIAQYERGNMGVSEYIVNKIVAQYPEYDPQDILNPQEDDTYDEAQGGQE